MKLIIGIPAYNEEKNIAKTILNLEPVSDKIVVCNDGSKDLTSMIAKKMGADVVDHPKNLGYGAGIRSIFQHSIKSECDILVTFDGDGQHRIEDIMKVVDPILKNEADIVIGSRFLGDQNSQVPNYRKLGIKAITTITNFSTSNKITDAQSGFRAYKTSILKDILPSDYGMGGSTEILVKANKQNLRITEVPITILYEGNTSTHNPASHGISVLLSTVRSHSIEHPLKIYGIPGLIFFAIGLFFIVWTIQGFSETRQIITNVSLIGIGSTILGGMFMMTAVILYSLVNVVRESRSD